MCATLGHPDHSGELAAGEGADRAQSRDASGSPGEEAAPARHRRRRGGECVSRDASTGPTTIGALRRRRRRPTTFTWRVPRGRAAGPRCFGSRRRAPSRTTGWCAMTIGYLQLERQSGQPPARSTVHGLRGVDGPARDSLSRSRDALDGNRGRVAAPPATAAGAPSVPPAPTPAAAPRRPVRAIIRGGTASRSIAVAATRRGPPSVASA